MGTPSFGLRMHQLTLSMDHRVEKNATIRTVKLRGEGCDVACEFYINGLELPPPRSLDAFLVGLLFRLLTERRPVHVAGSLTKACLRNIVELQQAWSLWWPDRYGVFPITATELIDPPPSNIRNTVCAFSGGVDGAFSLVRHAEKLLGEASLPVSAAVLIHGFDVPLSKPDSFERLMERCRPIADRFRVDLLTIRTTLRQASNQIWEDSFAAQLACCLQQLEAVADGGIIGSSEPYNQLLFPWGSTPASDYLLSGGLFSIFHDGAAYSRTAKVAQLAAFPEVIRALKFCWAGPNPEENCGACEKCLRTYLNFRASGIEHPECMPIPTLEQLANIPLKSQLLANEILQALEYARNHGRTGPWLEAANRSIVSFEKKSRVSGLRTTVKRIPIIGPFLRTMRRRWSA